MSKMMVVLATIALIACDGRSQGSSGTHDVLNFEKVSEAIMQTSFQDVDQLNTFLAKLGVAYTVTPVSEDYLMVEPTLCASRVGSHFKFAYLRLEGATGPKLYRYRLYWHQAGPLCIEEDFSFKNPYE